MINCKQFDPDIKWYNMGFVDWLKRYKVNKPAMEACFRLYSSLYESESEQTGVPTDETIDNIMSNTIFAHLQEPAFEDRVKYVKGVIHSKQFPLRVFRALRIPRGKELKLDDAVGEHWTYDYTLFDRHDGLYGFSSNRYNVILSGMVTPDQINWPQTIINNAADFNAETYCCYKNAEHEIELKRGTIPHDLEIWSDERETKIFDSF